MNLKNLKVVFLQNIPEGTRFMTAYAKYIWYTKGPMDKTFFAYLCIEDGENRYTRIDWNRTVLITAEDYALLA